jgi:hypothetical protein
MRKYLVLIIALFILLVLTSCREDEGDKIAQREIRDILYDVSVNFNLKNVYGIMEHLHTDYLHKGNIAHHFNTLWLNRMQQFSLLEIEVLYIEIDGNKAVAHTRNKFISAFETNTLNEPADNGDISYFYRDNGNWYIYGNQQWFKKR